jgi:hypothetical protein
MEIENDAVSAPLDTAVSDSAPVESSTPSEAGSGSARDAIDRAFAQVDAGQGTEAPAETSAAADTRKRDAAGKFAKVEAEAAAEAVETPVTTPDAIGLEEPPSRFTADAKAAWKDAPPALKGEVKRAFSELEGGINQYKERMAPLQPFFEMAAKSNTTVPEALQRYTTMEQTLRSNPMHGLELVCQNLGTSLRAVAAHVMGQPQNQQQTQADQTIHQLRAQISQLTQQVGGITQSQEQRELAEAQREVASFAADKPRFEELKPTIRELIVKGFASDLQDAYQKADRLNPASVPAQGLAPTAAPAAPSTNLAAQTRKGSLSVTGAPSSGSNPTNRKPPSSPRDALDRSFNALGIS